MGNCCDCGEKKPEGNPVPSNNNASETDLETGAGNGATSTGASGTSGTSTNETETKAENDENDENDAPVTTTGNNGSGDNSGDTGNDAAPPAQGNRVVTRYEIREMSAAMQNRFFDAVDKMLENSNGPGTSEFFRVAGYHGSPPPIYCKHGRETFPGWHRIYLLEFEKALQAADVANGNDGNIGLPYWDWSVRPQDGLPSIVRQRFSQWPNDLFPSSVTNAPSQLTRASDSQISTMLNEWGVITQAQDCLLATQHFAHASTGGQWASQYPSVESPHNSVHSIVGGSGGPMGGVAWAAFDIAFWLHHCQVDRIYETYLELEPDSQQEFDRNQESQSQDIFEEAFEPFRDANNQPYYPRDTFDTRKLGFVYNTPWPKPTQQLRLAPTVALFSNVKVSEFESKCYQIHVYVVSKNEEAKFNEPQTLNDVNFDSDNYAGGGSIFGRGMECKNCESRLPYDIVVDITKTLGKLQLSRYDAKLKVYCMETTETSGNLIKVEDTPLPEPIITGPLFEDQNASLKQDTKDTQNAEEVRALQRYLKRFGYYDDELDGSYGPITEKAVKVYQTATGDLESDGKAGPLTKKSIRDKRRCSNRDPFGDNKMEDDLIDEKNDEMYSGKNEIKYHIGVCPGYLSRDAALHCFAKAFGLWSQATKNSVSFVVTNDAKNADIKLSWSNGSMRDGMLMKFDGAGGVLGHGGTKNDDKKGFVVFDKSERWVIGYETEWNKKEMAPSNVNDHSTWYRGQPAISLYYTSVHEIGHALGLDHSINAKDFMSPFYDPNKNSLSENDIARIQAKFSG